MDNESLLIDEKFEEKVAAYYESEQRSSDENFENEIDEYFLKVPSRWKEYYVEASANNRSTIYFAGRFFLDTRLGKSFDEYDVFRGCQSGKMNFYVDFYKGGRFQGQIVFKAGIPGGYVTSERIKGDKNRPVEINVKEFQLIIQLEREHNWINPIGIKKGNRWKIFEPKKGSLSTLNKDGFDWRWYRSGEKKPAGFKPEC